MVTPNPSHRWEARIPATVAAPIWESSAASRIALSTSGRRSVSWANFLADRLPSSARVWTRTAGIRRNAVSTAEMNTENANKTIKRMIRGRLAARSIHAYRTTVRPMSP
jgi:hypothetical protein